MLRQVTEVGDPDEEIPTKWRPLSLRSQQGGETADGYDALHDHVPGWLAPTLARWTSVTLLALPRGLLHSDNEIRIGLGLGKGEERALEVERLLRQTYLRNFDERSLAESLVAIVRRGHEVSLDIVDALLRIDRWSTASQLENALRQSGSAWTVGEMPDEDDPMSVVPCLVRRVDPTAIEQFETVTAPDENAAAHLRAAWAELYGRSPSPSDAVDHAVKAVEAAVRPVVTPTDNRATLGKMISAMVDKPTKWQVVLSGAGRDHDGVEVVIDMLRLLWTSQHDRHGDDRRTAPMSEPEAEAAVHLAVTLVHWFQAGLVTRAGT